MIGACYESAKQLVRDFNELSFLKANKNANEFAENTRKRVLEIIEHQVVKSNTGHGIITNNAIVKPSKTGMFWAINPVDSMTNFIHRLPFFGTSIALLTQLIEAKTLELHNYQVYAAIFYDPIRDDTFWAERKIGTFLNSRKLALAQLNQSQQMKLVEKAEETRPNFIAGCANTANRNFGSSVMHMAYLAAGRIDATYERIDDFANVFTGQLLVQEAKGIARFEKDKAGQDLIIAKCR